MIESDCSFSLTVMNQHCLEQNLLPLFARLIPNSGSLLFKCSSSRVITICVSSQMHSIHTSHTSAPSLNISGATLDQWLSILNTDFSIVFTKVLIQSFIDLIHYRNHVNDQQCYPFAGYNCSSKQSSNEDGKALYCLVHPFLFL